MSEHNKEYHSIDNWAFFYSKEPEELINNLSYGNKELSERLSYANRAKFAEVLKNLNQFVIKMFEYAKESNVVIKEGSLALIPENPKSMQKFVDKLRGKVSEAARKMYPNEKEVQNYLETIFSD